MRDVNTKVDDIDTLPAANFNAQRAELENAVTSTDQTLDPDAGPDTDLNMLGKAVAAYANAGNVYQDSGVADAYVLSIASNLKSVTKYYDNMMIVFKAGNSSTGASTVNVNALGVKSVTLSDGTALVAGDIAQDAYILAIYNLSSDRFEITFGFAKPNIQNYTNAQHDHADAAGGGTLATSDIATFTQNSASGLTFSTIADLVTVDLGTVTIGDVFMMDSLGGGLKGGTSGLCEIIQAYSSGTATVVPLDGSINPTFSNSVSNAISWSFPMSRMWKVTVSGTLIMRIRGVSSGSSTTNGFGNIGASFLIKQ